MSKTQKPTQTEKLMETMHLLGTRAGVSYEHVPGDRPFDSPAYHKALFGAHAVVDAFRIRGPVRTGRLFQAMSDAFYNRLAVRGLAV